MPTIQLVGWLVNTIKEAITMKINSIVSNIFMFFFAHKYLKSPISFT